MKPERALSLDAYLEQAGKLTVKSGWHVVTQKIIDTFADAIDDHQFIHVDPVRAKNETSFGGTIAHGFLTLSLLSKFASQALPSIENTVIGINYGFDKVRFLTPVRAGAKLRGIFHLAHCEMRNENELLRRYDVTIEIENIEKPALVGQWLTLAILKPAKK